MVIAGAFVAARFVVRLGIIQNAGSDDWFISGSLVSLYPITSITPFYVFLRYLSFVLEYVHASSSLSDSPL